jgi:hypothetical protein
MKVIGSSAASLRGRKMELTDVHCYEGLFRIGVPILPASENETCHEGTLFGSKTT